ncbi:MAG TPA: hypothetical protein VGJ91_17560 [Polyangiaceae bacterium]
MRLTEDRLQQLRQGLTATSNELSEFEARAEQLLRSLGSAKPLTVERGLADADPAG